MCGIGGWIALGDARPPSGAARELMLDLESRGQDACGLAWVDKWGGTAKKYKTDDPAHKAWRRPVLNGLEQEIDQAQVCFVHARAQTKGSAKIMANNHPVVQTAGRYLLVHNGVLDNDDELFEDEKTIITTKREAQVDTEALVALLNAGKTPEEAVLNLEYALGSLAIAAMPRIVDHVLLARRGSPLLLAFDPKLDIVWFASEGDAIWNVYDICGRAKEFGFALCSAPWPQVVKEGSYCIITPKGLLKDGKLGTNSKYAKKVVLCKGWNGGENETWHGRGSQNFPLFYIPALEAEEEEAWRTFTYKLKDPLGFRAPAVLGKSGMRRIGYGAFPLGQYPKTLTIECPACWVRVFCVSLEERKYACPNCKTQLDKPSLFRTPTHMEISDGVFAS